MTVKQFLSIVTTGLLFGILLQPAYAQDASPTIAPTSLPTTATQITSVPTRTTRQEMKNTIKEFRTKTREQVKDAIQQRKEENAARRESFRSQLLLIKDERKKQLVDQLDAKIALISINRTDSMNGAIERLETLLEKLKAKAALAKQNGADTTNVDLAITEAENAITAAANALATQTAKSYTFTVTDENAKSVIGQTTRQLSQDLQDVHKKVKEAKQALKNVAVELRKIWKDVKLSGTPIPTLPVSPTAVASPTAAITTTP